MTKSSTLVEQKDCWIMPCDEGVVTRCYVDYGFGFLVLFGEETFEVRIECEFVLESDVEELMLYPGTDSTKVAPALTILHRKVEGLVAFKDGRLEVRFSGGIRILVPMNREFEAWQVSGENGLLIVALPGGGVAVWSGNRE